MFCVDVVDEVSEMWGSRVENEGQLCLPRVAVQMNEEGAAEALMPAGIASRGGEGSPSRTILSNRGLVGYFILIMSFGRCC